jgi:L-ribulose-5-phosphate 4-epimerase
MAIEQEGVIKYQLEHTQTPLPTLPMAEMNAWRSILFQLGLIGQDSQRYGGYGYGNISQRLSDGQFIISGTQTGHLATLPADGYCLVTAAFPQQNRLCSIGMCQPSSEALTHANLYLQDSRVQAVVHVHSPPIWQQTHTLKLPHTDADIAYGTPTMAAAVAELFKQQAWHQSGVFSMLGHEDGVVAFGASLQEATRLLIDQLALALQLATNY